MLDSVAVKMDGLAEQFPGPDFRSFPDGRIAQWLNRRQPGALESYSSRKLAQAAPIMHTAIAASDFSP
jgi:hypothetical protein